MIYKLNELPRKERTAAGGKGGTLARLKQAGHPVPEGFVILPAAFSGYELTPQAASQVEALLERMKAGRNGQVRFAVRSSALNEDSRQDSFAGEFETELNVTGDKEVRRAIEKVHRSGESERVSAYTEARGMAGDQQVAVVVQEMVHPDYSGVLFTADPVSGSTTHMMGNFVTGLGESLVSGESTGEAFRLGRPYGRYEGPRPLRRFGRRLFRLAKGLERELGGPQDIEFAIAGRKIHLLQARPITTLRGDDPVTGAWNDSRRGDFLWTNTNFGEALPDVMTPFTWSIFQIYFEEVIPFKLPGNPPFSGNIGGRFYFNVSAFASMVAALKFDPYKMLANDETFGPIPPGVEIPLQPYSLIEAIRYVLPLIVTGRRRVKREREGIPAYLDEAQALVALLRAQIRAAETPAELIALWKEHLDPYARRSSRTVQASFGKLQDTSTRLRRELTKLVGSEDAGTLLTGLGEGNGHLESLGPLLGLDQVAQGKMSRKEYLRRYGHRGPNEAEMSTPRPAEDPEWLDRQLARLKLGEVGDAEALLERQAERQRAAWQRLVTRYPRKAAKLRRRLNEVAEASRVRELVRSEATRMLWMAREFALKAGELTGLGEDIFFLSSAEILGALEGDKDAVSFIPARRETYERYRALPPYPSIIRGRFDPFEWAADPERRSDLYDATRKITAEASELITGFPGAAGRVEGIVRRLDAPDEADRLQPGEILVTSTTNIGWTPLFPRVAAIVTDIGAPLSHAAIVARELGIPAVVGTGYATMRLRSGDRVVIDGGQGTVEILNSPDVA